MALWDILAATGMTTGLLIPLWALGHCFFGYVLFRAVLAINGLLGGFLLGAHFVSLIRQTPTVADIWVAGIVAGVLLMLAAWFLCRAAFAAAVGLAAAAAVLHGWPASPAAVWTLAAVLGAVAAGAAFVFLRELVSVVTALGGAAATVVFVVDEWFWQGFPREWMGRSVPLTLGAVGAFVLLAALGLAVQLRLRRRYGRTFGPPGRSRRAFDTRVRPRFTKV